jgi:hypothetical protein
MARAVSSVGGGSVRSAPLILLESRDCVPWVRDDGRRKEVAVTPFVLAFV